MKYLLLLLPFTTFASEQVAHLDHLITVTKKTLENEMELKENLLHYEAALETYNGDKENKDLLLQVVEKGKVLHQNIERSHLSYLFSEEFLEELKAL